MENVSGGAETQKVGGNTYNYQEDKNGVRSYVREISLLDQDRRNLLDRGNSWILLDPVVFKTSIIGFWLV